ncbi:MAG: adenylate/guanylate cyclase domain-containing protein [Chloroflexi bacterium]|nr:adenylate/guanylate cyclase domain-containing protein [Chloroflexota bacterium]
MSDDKTMFDQMWHDWFMTDAFKAEKRITRFLGLLPHEPRCKFCHAPFEGAGAAFVRAFYGKKRSTLNPRFCNVCEDFANKHPGGHEVEMSMLFADVRGSTALSEQMSPTDFSRLINRFYVESTNAIVREDGLVEKLAGDAVAAFWGAGIAGPDYVARTIHAAQNVLKIMGQQKIPVGIGVHSGVAFFGAMGSADGLVNISAIGDEVNTAARLASKAAAGEIIVSEKALQQAHADGSGLEARSLELKGISEPIRVRVMRG